MKAEKSKKWWMYLVSLLGGLGTGLQNYSAVASFTQGLMSASQAATKAGVGLIQGFAVVLGGVCSTLVNFCMSIGLLEKFYERLTEGTSPQLSGWQSVQYWAGCAVFIGTGLLFGLTVLAFGPVGPLAAIGIVAGIFVAIIMMIQELETWLESFDDEEENKKSFLQAFSEWKNSLTWGKALGMLISIGNVLALSLLFTMGLASFFMSLGVPAFTAVIVGFAVAFSGGAFTEFYFYNGFLSKFCDNFSAKWEALWQANNPLLGLSTCAANAIVNAVLSYAGIIMITSLLAAASIAVPPFGAVIAVAVIAALFAGSASFVLGMDFWIENSAKITSYFSGEEEVVEPLGDTKSIAEKLEPGNNLVLETEAVAVANEVPMPSSATASLSFFPSVKQEVKNNNEAVPDSASSYDLTLGAA